MATSMTGTAAMWRRCRKSPVIWAALKQTGTARSSTSLSHIATGNETGLELVRQIYPRFAMTPGILMAPRFSKDATVTAALPGHKAAHRKPAVLRVGVAGIAAGVVAPQPVSVDIQEGRHAVAVDGVGLVLIQNDLRAILQTGRADGEGLVAGGALSPATSAPGTRSPMTRKRTRSQTLSTGRSPSTSTSPHMDRRRSCRTPAERPGRSDSPPPGD